MTKERLETYYHEWLCDIVCADDYSGCAAQYSYLLEDLDHIEFIFTNPMDENRMADGLDLRYRFCFEKEYGKEVIDILKDNPCSVLEMLAALSVKCEEIMMDDSGVDRTGRWFWEMIFTLGLRNMTNDSYNHNKVISAVQRFMWRDYDIDGSGGIFHVYNKRYNMRKAEFWAQALWHLDEVLDL